MNDKQAPTQAPKQAPTQAAKQAPTQAQIDTATAYVRSAAGQRWCPVQQSNCVDRCVCFQVKSYAKGMQAKCAHLKVTISQREYAA